MDKAALDFLDREMEGVFGVRKGAWTKEEDTLLRQCIATYGEGQWHQIPPRAGLNRCRKSCRLRWLNYLRPNIKRGVFEEDEVDLMIKLHKLLGNRWSLIAGRLPGRTANDVKNYWNTHLRKKEENSRERKTLQVSKSLCRPKVIRPQPRTFSKGFILRCQQAQVKEFEQRKEQPTVSSLFPSLSPSKAVAEGPRSPENEKEWCETVFEEVVEEEEEGMKRDGMISVGGLDLEQPSKSLDEVGEWGFEETGWDWWRDIEFDIGFDFL